MNSKCLMPLTATSQPLHNTARASTARVQSAVTPPSQAWALDDGDEELDLETLENIPQTQVNVTVGRVKMPLAIPENVEEAVSDKSEASVNLTEADSDEESEENWGVFPDEPDETPIMDVRPRQKLDAVPNKVSVQISGPSTPSRAVARSYPKMHLES